MCLERHLSTLCVFQFRSTPDNAIFFNFCSFTNFLRKPLRIQLNLFHPKRASWVIRFIVICPFTSCIHSKASMIHLVRAIVKVLCAPALFSLPNNLLFLIPKTLATSLLELMIHLWYEIKILGFKSCTNIILFLNANHSLIFSITVFFCVIVY